VSAPPWIGALVVFLHTCWGAFLLPNSLASGERIRAIRLRKLNRLR
jgi:hypothetical protein